MSEQKHRCAKCDKPAEATCGGCKDGLDIHGKPSAAYYCSKECQTTHWKTHKSDCKASNHRKQLYRTGELARKVFFDLRRVEFDIKIGKVVKKDGLISIREGQYADDEVLIGLPEGVLETRQDEETVLAYVADSKGLSIMHKLVASSLEGSYKIKCEATMFGAAGKIRVGCPNPEQGPRGRSTFRVELKDGNTYAMDPTIAQFGFHQVVMPWEEYCGVLDLQSSLTSGKPMDLSSDQYSYRNIIMIVQRNMTSCVYSAANAWMTMHDQKVSKMIMLSKPQFEQELEEFTSFVKHHVALFVDWINAGGFKQTINTFKDVFEGYLKERMKETRNPEAKNDEELDLQQKQAMDDDGLLELEKAFRKL